MASIISAGTTDSTSLNVSGDKTGILQLASNNAVTAVTIDTSQNVGIGTTSPSAKHHVSGGQSYVTGASGAGAYSRWYNNAQTTNDFQVGQGWASASDNVAVVNNNANAAMIFGTNGTERMRIDSSGNVGIGVAPNSSWQSTANALQLGANVSLSKYGMNYNAYYDGTNYRYLNNGYAAQYQQGQNHYWLVAGSGTAGAVISGGGFNNGTIAMTLNSSSQLVMATSTYGLNGQLQVGITASTSGMNSLFSVAGDQNGGYPIGSRGNSSTQGLIGFFDGSNNTIGSITKSGSSVAYNTSSDYRLKENIVPMTGALAKVAQLKPVTYKWKADGKDGQGFIAHELAEVVPDCVNGEKDAVETYKDEDGNEQTRPKYQGVDTSYLVATLTAAIQEQQSTINALTARIETLENK